MSRTGDVEDGTADYRHAHPSPLSGTPAPAPGSVSVRHTLSCWTEFATVAERFRMAARRWRAYNGQFATAARRENRDGEGPEEDQPRDQEAQGRQEEARPAARHRGERVRQAEARRAGGGEAEIEGRPQLDFGHLQKKTVAKQGLNASSPLPLNH